MKTLLRIALTLALLTAPAVALAATAVTKVPNCNTAVYKPKRLVLACGDGGYLLSNIVPNPDAGASADAAAPVDAGPTLYLPAGYTLVPFLTDTAGTHTFKQADSVIDPTKGYVVVIETWTSRVRSR